MDKGYISSYIRVPEVTKLYLDKLLEKYTKQDYQFYAHVLNSTLISYMKKEDGWVPISAALIRKRWGKKGVNFQKMIEDEILELYVINQIEIADGIFLDQVYSKKDRLSRCFRVPEEILDDINYYSPKTIEEFAKTNYFNLMNWRKISQVRRYPKKDENEKKYPELVVSAMENIPFCIVNGTEIARHIESRKLKVHSIWGDYEEGDKNKSKERRGLIIDDYCWKYIMSNVIKTEGDLVHYKVCFNEPQRSGRLSESGSGMQSCSKQMKKAAFSGIAGLRNYDLKSSQVFGLKQWFEEASVDTSWLDEYLLQDKQVYADAVGISKDRWKQCFLALIMGGYVQEEVTRKKFEPRKIQRKVKGQLVEKEEYPDEDILKALCEEANGDVDKALNFYIKFYRVVEPLKKEIDKWQNWLLEKYIPGASIYPGGKQILVNKTGMTFNLSEYKNDQGDWVALNPLKRKLTAFLLQGSEAGFIHHLTILSKRFGYQVLSNQHDGLVTIGEIPLEAQEIARKNSGLKYAELEEKDFL